MAKPDHNAETAEEEEAEENISGMNNQDSTENSQNTNIRQHVFFLSCNQQIEVNSTM